LQGHAVTIFAQTLNVLFSALTCYPIYHLGKKTFDVRTGAAAAWLWAFLPTAILMPIAWTWDQSLSALLLATLLAFTYALRRAGLPLYWVAYGLLWGVAALTNPSLCVVMPFLWLWLWFQRWEAGLPSVALLARAALFFALAIAPWTVRNYIELGSPVFGKSNFGLEFWLGNNPTVKDVFSPDLHPMWNYDEYRQLVLEGEPRYNRAKAEQARAFIKAHPTRFLVLCGHRLLDMWTGIYESDLGTYLKPLGLSRIFIWYTTAFSLVAFVGFLSVARECAMDSLPLILCFVIFPIPYYITHSSLRYRHPIDPVLTLFCVVAVSGLTAFFGRRKELISHRSIQHQRKEPALP
jgi:4-amino-4-deoxy-L-arabinose transferase-like glycosyltransferase